MSTIAELLVKIGADVAGFAEGMDAVQTRLVQVGKDFDSFGANLGSLTTVLDKMAGRFASAGIALSAAFTVPLTLLGKSSLDAAVEMDSLNRALLATAGSAEGAAAQMTRLQEVAKLPGINLKEAVQMSVQLQQTGMSAARAERDLTLFGNALAVIGRAGGGNLTGTMVQWRQMFSTDFVKGGDLKPIIDRVPQVAKILKDAFGTDVPNDLKKLGITTAEVMDTIERGLAKLPSSAGGAQNALENMADTIFRIKARLGAAELPFLDVIEKRLLPIIDQLSQKFANLPPGAQAWIVGVAGALVLLGPALLGITGSLKFVTSLLDLFTGLGKAALQIPKAIEAVQGLVLAVRGLLVLPFAAIGQAFAIFTEGGIVAGISAVGGAFVGLLPVIGLVVGAIGTLLIGYEIYKHWEGVKGLLVGVWTDLSNLTQQAWTGMKNFLLGTWQGVVSLAAPIWQPVANFFSGLWSGVAGAFTGVWNSVSTFLVGVWQGIAGYANTIWSWIVSKIQGALDWLAKVMPATAKAIGNFGAADASAPSAPAGTPNAVMPNMPAPGVFTRAPKGDGSNPAYEYEKAIKEAFSLAGVKDESLEIEKTENAVRLLEKAYADGKITTDSFTAAHAALESRLDMLREGFNSTADRAKAYKAVIDGIDKADAFINFTNNPLAGAPNIGGDGKPVAAVPATIGDVFKDGMSQAIGATAEFDRALKTLGITHHTTAAQMKQAWEEVRDSSIASSREKLEAERAYLKAVSAETGQLTKEQQQRLKEIDAALDGQAKKVSVLWQDVSREVSKAFDHMARGMAQSIVEWKGFGETLKSVFQSFAEGILEIMFQQLLNPLKKGITNLLLGDGKSSGGLLGSITGGLFGGGSKGGGIFSALGGGIPSAASSIGTGDIFDVALGGGGAAAGGGGLFSGLLGGLTSFANPLSLITGGIGAIGSVIGAIGSMRQEGTLNAIEESTRYVKGYMRDNIIPDEQVWWPRLGDIEMILHDDFSQKLTQMRDDIHTVAYPPPGSANAPIMVSGNLVLGDGDIERFADKLVGILKARGVYPQGK